MHKNQDKAKHSIKNMCKVLNISEAGYYKWLRRQSRPYKYEELLAKIRQIRADNPDYGAYRIYLDLQLNQGYTGSYYVILKLCKTHKLMLKKTWRPRGITKVDPAAQASANLIQQDFSAEAPNQKWLGDITEIPTAGGKLYVAGVLDCFDGAIVGLQMADNMRAELCVDAFTSATNKHQAYGMIFHSDRGSQYTSKLYRDTLARYGVTQSMSATGRCYDNARMESFFATLKKECIYKLKTETMRMATVKSLVFRFIEIYYNRRRIYTPNEGYPPLVKRSLYYQQRLPQVA
ncbi:MAG: IS3 family transposase [Syntrophomonadaceae bacterium]|nr:IS3 family transposase [Syntrophomonadaceae bacterium]MDD4803136.1 IS3 family transposase [Syntrophomonas sp.]